MELRPIDHEAAALLCSQRWAALALAGPGGPTSSMVAYAPDPASGDVLLFLSGLAAHTRLLAETGRAALAVSAPDLGAGDPQELPRLSVAADATVLERGTAAFETAWPVYAARFPASEPRLALADFTLFRLVPTSARYVGGFARAASLDPGHLAAAVVAGGSR